MQPAQCISGTRKSIWARSGAACADEGRIDASARGSIEEARVKVDGGGTATADHDCGSAGLMNTSCERRKRISATLGSQVDFPESGRNGSAVTNEPSAAGAKSTSRSSAVFEGRPTCAMTLMSAKWLAVGPDSEKRSTLPSTARRSPPALPVLRAGLCEQARRSAGSRRSCSRRRGRGRCRSPRAPSRC